MALAGCKDERSESTLAACDRDACEQRCLDLAGDDCDVLNGSCQQRIFEAVSCVRGGGGSLPAIRALTEDEIREEQAAADDVGVDAGADAGPEEDDGGIEQPADDPVITTQQNWDTALRLLLLRVPQSEDETVDNLGGYYDSNERRITLVDRGSAQDDPSSQQLLAHELVHALQDQHMGLSDVRRATGRSHDAQLALGCLLEGDAELHSELAWTILRGLPIDDAYAAYVDASIDWTFKYNRDAVLNADSPYDQAWLLRYAVGARYLFDLWRSEGSWGVQSLYEAPPLATVYWMNGFAANQARTEPLTANLACNVAHLPKGYERRASDTMGAFNVFSFLGRHLTKRGVYQTEKNWDRARAWRQDHFEVFSNPQGETALSWRIRFADENIAKEIAQELEKLDLPLRIARNDAELEVFTSDSRATVAAFVATRPDKCPKLEP
jgi:hypothetical protein